MPTNKYGKEKEAFKMDEEQFAIAFAVNDIATGKYMYDSALVDWEIHIYEGEGGNSPGSEP